MKTSLAMQLRYRYSRLFEPALEFYQNQDILAIDPAIMGNVRLGIAKKNPLGIWCNPWTDNSTPNQTIRALIEYEF